MNDPYSVLGVAPNASDDEIKKAYRELVRKYHPDNYHNNPLADLAQEKMKEINEAYDAVTKGRTGGYGGSGAGRGGYGGGAYTGSTGSSPEFTKVRMAINAGNIAQAEELLNASSSRSAEWHFLMGSVCYRKGWLDDAMQYYQTAVSMEPGNQEYVQALNFMSRAGTGYSPFGYQYGAPAGGCSACDICTALLCADMCCHC
ncbi:DnaJ domain-containing protein [Oscillospiraceae bacterium WX1]